MPEEKITMVMVKVLDPALKSYSAYRYEELSCARQGEADGKWKIIEDEQEQKVLLRETRAGGGSGV
jgi:hypothetical protein